MWEVGTGSGKGLVRLGMFIEFARTKVGKESEQIKLKLTKKQEPELGIQNITWR